MIIKNKETLSLHRKGDLIMTLDRTNCNLRIVRLRYLLHRYNSKVTTIESILLEYIIVKSRL